MSNAENETFSPLIHSEYNSLDGVNLNLDLIRMSCQMSHWICSCTTSLTYFFLSCIKNSDSSKEIKIFAIEKDGFI